MKNSESPKKDIPFEKFNALDILIGQIISVKNISNKNLLSFKVDVKKTVLNIVSRESFKIDLKKILGQKIVVLSNLKPFKIEGHYSDGIILIAKDIKGNASFIFPESQDVEVGSKIH